MKFSNNPLGTAAYSAQKKFESSLKNMKATLDGIEDDVVAIKSDIESLTHEVSTISAKMDALLLSLGITFNASNEIISNGYTAHKHTYIDTTIADTETGGSSPSNTTKITSGVA